MRHGHAGLQGTVADCQPAERNAEIPHRGMTAGGEVATVDERCLVRRMLTDRHRHHVHDVVGERLQRYRDHDHRLARTATVDRDALPIKHADEGVLER